MGEQITIGLPHVEVRGESARLVAPIALGGGPRRDFFFEVDRGLAHHLTPERSDAFVLMFLDVAMERGWDIAFEAPMTAQLAFQLQELFIPNRAACVEQYSAIQLLGPVAETILPTGKAVACGFSAGVDSFYTLRRYGTDDGGNHPVLTHLLFANVGAIHPHDYEHQQPIFAARVEEFSQIASEAGLQLVAVNTNLAKMFDDDKGKCQVPGILKTVACIYALARLFRIYLHSSGDTPDKIGYSYELGQHEDELIARAVSVAGLDVYAVGTSTPRMEKVRAIADDVLAQRHLRCCFNEVQCGVCAKCLRTQAELDALGKLELFGEVFDVGSFMANREDKLAYYLAGVGPGDAGYTVDIEREYESRGVSLARARRLAILKWRPYNFVRTRFAKYEGLRRWVREHELTSRLGIKRWS